MKSIFMRVLFRKIHCPSFICFCKPSSSASAATHLCNPGGPFKLDNSPHLPSPSPSPTLSVSPEDASSHHLSSPLEPAPPQLKEETLPQDGSKQEQEQLLPRSCIKKPPSKSPSSPKSLQKKKVQWMDNLGKQLVDIKEFESSETGDTDNEEENRGCICNIL